MKTLTPLYIIAMCLCGCVSTETLKQEAEIFAINLETQKDPIETIKAYKEYEKAYQCYINNICKEGEKQRFYSIQVKALAQPDFKLQCLQFKNYTQDESDECILYRREIGKSPISYFDFARFLPTNSPIKTDEDFEKLVQYYDKQEECNRTQGTTTQEKQTCKDTIENTVRQLASKKIHCKKLYSEEYEELLIRQGRWYEWAIDHDPEAYWRQLREIGEYVPKWVAIQPVFSPSEALQEVKETITEFGTEHLCTTDGWKQDIENFGYYL